jgi:hypothetical protein
MAKLALAKEVWLSKDAAWLQQRESDWDKIELCLASNADINQMKAYRRYFMKGEWTEGARMAPSPAMRFILCPEHSPRIYHQIIAAMEADKNKLHYYRCDLLWLLMADFYDSLLLCHAENTQCMINYLLNERDDYHDDMLTIDGVIVRGFPFDIYPKSPRESNFFLSFIHCAGTWLETVDANPYCGIQYLTHQWFTGLSFMHGIKEFNAEDRRNVLYPFFLQLHQYQSEHPSRAAAEAKQAFVDDFMRHASEYGFQLPELTDFWQQASQDSDQAWLENIWEEEVLPDDPKNQRAELPAWFDSFICPLPSSAKDVFAIIGQRLTSLGFSDTPYHAEQVQRVSLTPMLTIDFMAEMGFNIDEPVYAYQYDLLCSADFLGTDQCQLQYKVLLIDTAKPEPYVLLVECPSIRNRMSKNQRVLRNKRYLLDALREEDGLPFYRHYNFAQDPVWPKTIPPAAKHYPNYRTLMAIPFKDATYLPFKQGRFGLLLGLDEFAETEGQSYKEWLSGKD